jgi:filamentous hemagglutinin family protein
MQTNKWLLSLSVAVMATNVYALPEISTTAASDGANIHSNPANPTNMQIQQTAPNAVMNWHSFNVGSNESVHFQQPTAASIILNRVDPRQGISTIAGQISANGRVIISNAAGIHFTPSSRVDVAGLIATTANISNDNFKKGKYIFEDNSNLSGKVINEGIISINAKEHGFAALIAPNVANKGVITASLGKIAMYSTTKFIMNFSGNDLIHFQVPDRIINEVVMQGDIMANVVTFNHQHAHEVLDHAIHVPDNTIARSVSERNGVIILSAQPGSNMHASENNGTVTVAARRAPSPAPQNNMSSAYIIENYSDIMSNIPPVAPLAFPADDGRLSGESGYLVVGEEKTDHANSEWEHVSINSDGNHSIDSSWDLVSNISEGVLSIDSSDDSDAKSEMSNDSDYSLLTEERLAQHNRLFENQSDSSSSAMSFTWISSDVTSFNDTISFNAPVEEEIPTQHLTFRFNSAGTGVIIPNDVESDLHLAFRFDPMLSSDIIPIENEPNLHFTFRFNNIEQPQAVEVQQPQAPAMNAAVMNAPGIVQPPGGIAVPNDQDLQLNFRFANSDEPNPEPNPGPIEPLNFRFANNPELESHYIFRFKSDNQAPQAQVPAQANVINAPQPAQLQAPMTNTPQIADNDAFVPNKLLIQCPVKNKFVNATQGYELRCEGDFDLKVAKDYEDLITYPSEKPDEPQLDIEV